MKHLFISLLTALAATSGGLFPAAAAAPAELRIYTAIEVEFATESGVLYQLQGSSNLVDWSAIGEPVFGSGRTLQQVFSTRSGGEVAFQSYRLYVEPGPTNGLAPWSLAGFVLSLDDQPARDRMRFSTETTGVDEGERADAFTYEFSRLDLNTVTAEVFYSADQRDLLSLTFTAPGLGTWVREEYRKGKLKDRDVGVFSVISAAGPGMPPPAHGDTNQPPTVPVEIPTALAGLSYGFESGCGPRRLEFTSTAAGIERGDDVDDDEPNVFTYHYALTGTNTASLVVTLKPGRYDEYELIFLSGAQGRFVRREFRDGVLKDTDRGNFSSGGAIPVTPPTGSDPKPVDTLGGLTYVMSAGESPDRLEFTTATSGTEFSDDVGDTEPNVFIYAYEVTGPNTARLVIRFKADRWDEYDLEFGDGNAGRFVRREFQKSLLKDTDTGTFAGTRTSN